MPERIQRCCICSEIDVSVSLLYVSQMYFLHRNCVEARAYMTLSRNINPIDQYQLHLMQFVSLVPHLSSEEENAEQFSKEQLFKDSKTQGSRV